MLQPIEADKVKSKRCWIKQLTSTQGLSHHGLDQKMHVKTITIILLSIEMEKLPAKEDLDSEIWFYSKNIKLFNIFYFFPFSSPEMFLTLQAVLNFFINIFHYSKVASIKSCKRHSSSRNCHEISNLLVVMPLVTVWTSNILYYDYILLVQTFHDAISFQY